MRDDTGAARTRRATLRAAAGVAGLAAAGATSGAAESGTTTRADRQPDHVTIEFDRDELERWQPRVVTHHLDVKPRAQYAWTARSDEYDVDAWHTYWTFYPTQEGFAAVDSHWEDREPCYVAVSDDSIDHVVYTGWHWIAARDPTPPTDGDHVLTRAVEPHHQYVLTEDKGRLLDLEDMRDEFDTWLANGWDDDLGVPTATDPAVMDRRESWWRRSSNTRVRRLQADLALWLPESLGGPTTDL